MSAIYVKYSISGNSAIIIFIAENGKFVYFCGVSLFLEALVKIKFCIILFC